MTKKFGENLWTSIAIHCTRGKSYVSTSNSTPSEQTKFLLIACAFTCQTQYQLKENVNGSKIPKNIQNALGYNHLK